MAVLGLVMTEKLRSNTYRYSCCYLTGAKKPRRWVHVLIDTPLERGYFNPRFYHGRPTSVSGETNKVLQIISMDILSSTLIAQLSSQTSSTLPNLARHFPFITADSRTFLDSMALRAESPKSVNNLTDDLGGVLDQSSSLFTFHHPASHSRCSAG